MVERVPHHVGDHPENEAYRRTKMERMGHLAGRTLHERTGSAQPRGRRRGLTVEIVAAQWHTEVMDGLVAGAVARRASARAPRTGVTRVPGAFELTVVAEKLARGGADAIVASAWSSGEARRTSSTCARP